jgi:hypothetical protein
MRGGRHSRYTVYDIMEAKGVFEENPANSSSPRYAGPQEYPKMFYHPTGKQRVIQKAEILQTAYGPVKVGEMMELISRTVHTRDDEERARAAGWHDHPAKAIAASGAQAPAMAASGRVAELEHQMLVLQAQLAAARQAAPPEVDDFIVDEKIDIRPEEFDESIAASIPTPRPNPMKGM